ncbi:hypothetical protein [Evansella clarkii]|uniref:hypothetical protein n=1 Tax=Evansella clarkii TaxID=79879 RepID=UPI0009971AB5|nr:hypothetical protein [Evansella clarkii]
MARHDMKGLKNNKETKEKDDGLNEPEKSSFNKRFEGLRDKLKLGSHHKMERFTAMLGVTLSFLLMFSIFSFANHRTDVAQSVSAQAVYTKDFNFSLSNERVHVEGVFGNEDKTDVMILLRMQNPRNMSMNANNYELFITGARSSLSYEPDVTFSLFGSTGYGIIRFQDEGSIPQEVVDITIRSNTELSAQTGSGSSGDSDSTDGSFAEYDQGKLFVNPGAEDVETLDWLKTGEEDPITLYTALIAEPLDEEIRENIAKETEGLAQLLNRGQEYTNRLIAGGYEPPETPWFVGGDYIDDEGVFVAAQNVAGAHVLDYSTTSIRDGYINQVMSDLSSFDTYMKEAAEDTKDRDGRSEQVDRVQTLNHEDGSVLDLTTVSTGSSPSAQVAAKDSVESLQATWRTYLNTKSKLQRDLMRQLLVLDADIQSQASSYSIQSDEDAVIFY